MKGYYRVEEWKITEEGFNPEFQRESESIFALGNGLMGQRANFEEDYSGSSLHGHYLAGVYYPDKTKVGWWKNGYPEYFAKVINAPAWIDIRIFIDGVAIDLAKQPPSDFRRILHMDTGLLERQFTLRPAGGKVIEVNSRRFLSVTHPEAGLIRYSIKNKGFSGELKIISGLNGDVKNEDANYKEKFWEYIESGQTPKGGFLLMKTKKLGFHVCTGMKNRIINDGQDISPDPEQQQPGLRVDKCCTIAFRPGNETVIYKYAVQTTSLNHRQENLRESCMTLLDDISGEGFEKMLSINEKAWKEKWATSDVVIRGDAAAQQAIRFNIFQLNQTYTGEDERLNIGPKGFTGEKYGGSTYWDTEAYCFPFYLSTASSAAVARNLLLYRYKHLGKAIKNAEKLGFSHGAALYPMVTMNGEECHNEWEITFEEIHRNAAIAYAIYYYTRYTGDTDYLVNYGLEVLIAISRFWAQRVNFSAEKKKYVILGVTGPNEYENNVNNNWYTNTMAAWCLEYTLESIEHVKGKNPQKYSKLAGELSFSEEAETGRWKNIIAGMYYPLHQEADIFLQQEGYLDKEQMLAADLDPSIRPLNQHWSWDRILRSCFIKQADVLQGLFFLEDRYDEETIRRNFDYYEPRTVHESSLSPCVHAILAARIGYRQKAYELYLRTSRLDLDDYNHEVDEGLHITSMAGTWMSIVFGFGGMRTLDGRISFSPMIPEQWEAFSFHIRFRGALLNIHVSKDKVLVENQNDIPVDIRIYDKEYSLKGLGSAGVDL